MPTTSSCFSYPDPVSPGSGTLRWAPSGLRRMPASTTCFRYQAEAPPSRPLYCYSYQMTCLSYPPAGPACMGDLGDLPLAPPGVRQMPGTITCFRY
jgi:hypothetical protein